ncbi:MAG: SPASM domain-containing protein [Sphingobacteriaceae bacterium]|nr:SPASM domain-containing protein [Sphingobacteriaceae bacterium]
MHYYVNIIKKLSLYKIYNYNKLLASYFYSKLLKQNYHNALPFALSIEPTTSCNLRCPQCPSGLRQFTRPTGMLDPEMFKKFVLQIKKHVHSLTFYFQGEPYLNPDFLKMVRTASDNNLYTITSTNAHYLNDEVSKQTIQSGLDEIIISIDGTSQETYEQYRVGGQLDKVLAGAQNIIKWKKELKSRKPYVVFQFVAFRSNEHQVKSIKKLGRDMGADIVRIKTAQIYDFENSQGMIPKNEALSRYKKNSSGKWEIKNRLLDQCWRMWQACVITWDGKIVPCCFDKDAKYQLGDLTNNTFKEIWFSKPYHEFRQSILKSRKEIDICTNCTEGTKVWAD